MSQTITDHTITVRTWLLQAAPGEMRARREWANHGVTLLKCGVLFRALRMPSGLVQAALGTTDQVEIDERLVQALLGGPVVRDMTNQTYSALLPATAGPTPSLKQAGTAFLGDDFIGLPDPSLTRAGDGPRYWSVPMNECLDLCSVPAVAQLVEVGRLRIHSGWRPAS